MSLSHAIPITAARELCRAHQKAWCVIAAFDRRDERFYVTTYGHRADDKVAAAEAGDAVAEALKRSNEDGIRQIETGEDGIREMTGCVRYADFRLTEPAVWAAERERLSDRIRELEKAIRELGAHVPGPRIVNSYLDQEPEERPPAA